MQERQDRHRGSRLGDSSADDRLPGTQAVHPLGGQGGHGVHGVQGVQGVQGGEAALAGAEFGPQVNAGGSPAATPARPYGRIVIFTLLDDRVADFDRLAEQAAEEVRTGEPDTLVYVIHLVPNAPLQRIFYEIYRDRAAFDSHEGQPYMQRFVAERRSCVLATNVIELRLKYAKVAPLPNPQASAQVRPAAPPPATRAQLPPGPPQRLQPLPRLARRTLTCRVPTSGGLTSGRCRRRAVNTGGSQHADIRVRWRGTAGSAGRGTDHVAGAAGLSSV